MTDTLYMLCVAWFMLTVVYTALSGVGGSYYDNTREVVQLFISCKQLNIIGRIVLIPLYTIPVTFLLIPSLILYSIWFLVSRSLPFLFSVLFLKKEDNNG